MKAMLLAAGRGERMRPLTDNVPKPLLRIGDTTLIECNLLKLKKAGIREVIINLHYHPQKIIQLLGDGSQYGLNIEYSLEDEQLLGTGGGVRKALPLLGKKPFLLLSADIWTDFCFEELSQNIKADAHCVMVDNPDYNQHGDFGLNANGFLTNETPKFTYANIGVMHPCLFDDIPDGPHPLGDLLRKKVNDSRATGEFFSGNWHNVGTSEQLLRVQQLINKNRRNLS